MLRFLLYNMFCIFALSFIPIGFIHHGSGNHYKRLSSLEATHQHNTLFVFGINGNLGASIVQWIQSEMNCSDKKDMFEFVLPFDSVVGTYRCMDDGHTKFMETFASFPCDLQLIPFNDTPAIILALKNATHVLTTIPPVLRLVDSDSNMNIEKRSSSMNNPSETFVDPVLKYVLQGEVGSTTKDSIIRKGTWVGYVSMTGVYGDHKGDWVTEHSETRALNEANGRNKAQGFLNSEKQWSKIAINNSDDYAYCFHLKIFRCAGIYSSKASALHTVLRKGLSKKSSQGEEVYTSRIHIDDASRAILSSMYKHKSFFYNKNGSVDIFNIGDEEPAYRREVMEYAYKLLKANHFINDSFYKDGLYEPSLKISDRGRRRLTENKRVDSRKMKNDLLNNHLLFPTYREGIMHIVKYSKHFHKLL